MLITFVVLCAVGIELVVLGIQSAQNRAVSIALGVLLISVFASAFVVELRRRGPRFGHAAEDLECGIETYFRTGKACRDRS